MNYEAGIDEALITKREQQYSGSFDKKYLRSPTVINTLNTKSVALPPPRKGGFVCPKGLEGERLQQPDKSSPTIQHEK